MVFRLGLHKEKKREENAVMVTTWGVSDRFLQKHNEKKGNDKKQKGEKRRDKRRETEGRDV